MNIGNVSNVFESVNMYCNALRPRRFVSLNANGKKKKKEKEKEIIIRENLDLR